MNPKNILQKGMAAADGSQGETCENQPPTGFAHTGWAHRPYSFASRGSPQSQSDCQESCDGVEVGRPHCCLSGHSHCPGLKHRQYQALRGSARLMDPSTRSGRGGLLWNQRSAASPQQAGMWGLGDIAGAIMGKPGPIFLGSSLWGSLHTRPIHTPCLPPVRFTNILPCAC